MPPHYRDIPIEQVSSPVPAQHYRDLVLYAADYQKAGAVMLQAVTAATALLDKGAVLQRLLDAAREGDRGVN